MAAGGDRLYRGLIASLFKERAWNLIPLSSMIGP
jgi:hypothetical protein